MILSAFARWPGPVQLLRDLLGREASSPPASLPLTRPYPWEAHYPRGLAWDFAPAAKPLFSLLDEAVARYSSRPCLDFLGRKSTYKEIGGLVDRAAKGFQMLGVERGVRVGLFLPNCTYYVICYFAVLKAGGTVVNYNPLYAEREIARQIEDSRTSIMVTLNIKGLYPKVAPRLQDTCLETLVVGSMGGLLPWRQRTLFALLRRREIADVAHDIHHVKLKMLLANDGRLAPVEIRPHEDVAVLQYTGGTTGRPKGAMLTHTALLANSAQVRRWAVDARPGQEKIVGALPLFHVFGMTAVMNASLAAGFELILLPRFRLDELLKVIDRQRVTVMMGVPTMYSAINGSALLEDYDLSSLRFCVSGGAPLPRGVQETFERRTGCSLVEGYGLTEAGPVCTINPFGAHRHGSVGLPLQGTVVEIASIDEPDRLLPLGQRGEICISGPQVMAGYSQQPGETADVLRGGRLYTGDVGYLDQDGYLYLIDRIKDLILCGGFNVYPRMVEEAIALHPAVEEVAVCGVPDPHRGEIVQAFVKLRDGAALSAAELRGFLKDKLAPFEQPKRITFRDRLPKTFIGKPSRRTLIADEMRRLNAAPSSQALPASPPLHTRSHEPDRADPPPSEPARRPRLQGEVRPR